MIDLGKDMSIDEFGTSLLSRAQQNARRQRRRDRRSDRNAILALLGGQLVGGVLKNSFDKKYEDFLNGETELKRTAQIKSAIAQNNEVLAQERASLQYAGGQKKWLLNEIYNRNKAALDMQYYGQAPRDSKTLEQLAMTEAKKSLDQEFDLFNARIQAAKEFSSVAGSDMSRYTNALAANAKKERQIGSQLKRRFASFFRDEQDSDVDGALYKSATTEKIYKASQTYKDNFDTAYRVAGNARAAQRIAQALEDRKDPIPLSKGTFKTAKLLGQDVLVSTNSDGTYKYVQDLETGDTMSFETYMAMKRGMGTATKRDGERLGELINQLDEDTADDLRSLAQATLPRDATAEQRNNRFNIIGKDVSVTNRALESSYGDVATSPRLASISARSHLLDRNHFEQRPTLVSRTTPENPLVTLKAATEEFGSLDDIPPEFREALERDVASFINNTYASIAEGTESKPTLERLREIRSFAESMEGSYFGGEEIIQSLRDPSTGETLKFYNYELLPFLDKMIADYR
jgi:hypothetical protein